MQIYHFSKGESLPILSYAHTLSWGISTYQIISCTFKICHILMCHICVGLDISVLVIFWVILSSIDDVTNGVKHKPSIIPVNNCCKAANMVRDRLNMSVKVQWSTESLREVKTVCYQKEVREERNTKISLVVLIDKCSKNAHKMNKKVCNSSIKPLSLLLKINTLKRK